jgi:uncharacterized protein involved in exopolysaccharide biosynthesis/Mrp family chromosome partitioning ATPase
MILAVSLGGTVLILLGAMLIPARYTATAEIVLVPVQSGNAAAQLNEQIILTKATELKSESLLRRTVENLSRDPQYQADADQAVRQSRTPGDIVRGILRRGIPGWLSPWNAGPVCRRLRVVALRRQLKVAQEAGSHVIAVHATSTSPELAALIANRVTTLYLKSETENKQATARRALAWLDHRVPAAKAQMEAAETDLAAYRHAHGFAGVNPTAVSDEQFTELDRRIAAAQAALAADRSRLDGLRSGRGAAVLAALPDTPALEILRARAAGLRQSEAGLAASMGPNNPSLLRLRASLQEVQRSIGGEVGRAEAALRERARIKAAEVAALGRQLARVQDESGDMRLAELNRRATGARQLYDSLLRRREGLLEQLQTAWSGFEMVSSAVPPDRPSSPDPLLFGPPAFVFLATCAGFLAVGLERMDSTVRRERDITEALGIPCIGFMPRVRRFRRRRPHQALLRDTFGPYVEAIRSIVATSLVAVRRRSQVVLVTSSVPGEGKTALAVSYAIYAARLGRRTILLDLDFRHPTTAREFDCAPDDRTLQLVLQDRSIRDVIQSIPPLQLDYLPIGHSNGDPMRLFAGEQMANLLQRLRGQYECIVADSAPLLASSETRLLAAMADQVLFAVKWGSTDRRVARTALDQLRQAGVKVAPDACAVAAVLTQIDLRKHARSHDGGVAEALVRYGQYYGQAKGTAR